MTAEAIISLAESQAESLHALLLLLQKWLANCMAERVWVGLQLPLS